MRLEARSTRLGDTDPLEIAAAATGEGCFLRQEGLELAALGAAVVVEAHGPDRFARLERQARELLGEVQADRHAPPFAVPRLVGGFAFRDEPEGWDGFGAARLVLPELLVARAEGETWITSVSRRAEEIQRSAAMPLPRLRATGGEGEASFRARVLQALAAIRAGGLQKVVLARCVEMEASGEVSPFDLASALRRTQRGGLLYALRTPGAQGFVGTTPELLVRRRGRGVESCALAGSAGRGTGSLAASGKDAWEHELVAAAVREALRPVVELRDGARREVLELPHIEHLLTRIEGELRQEASALELAALLHPTPAVAGTPKAEALEWLAKHEALDRGWYCGGVGWMEAGGDGEFWVALRCARMEGRRVQLYAGAGVVEGSRPEAEWEETGMKLDAILSSFPS